MRAMWEDSRHIIESSALLDMWPVGLRRLLTKLSHATRRKKCAALLHAMCLECAERAHGEATVDADE
jgi:hypothetical protein